MPIEIFGRSLNYIEKSQESYDVDLFYRLNFV